MKFKSFIIMSSLVAALISCDTVEWSDSQPIVNPQEPIFEASGVTVNPSSDLSSSEVLNLQDMLDDDTQSIELFTIALTSDDLPEGSDVYAEFEVASNPEFQNSITYDNLVTEGSTVVLPFDDLLNAHQQMYGKAPIERTIYYRVPLFANVGGSVYRLNAQDYYYLSGSFNIIGLDPGFEIEDAYYILGTKGWNPLEDCVQFNHSQYSPYDDPDFTVTVTVATNTYFKIVPQSVYNMLEGIKDEADVPEDFWKSLVGVAENGDSSLSGELVTEALDPETGEIGEAGALLIEASGIYKITINMEDWTYTIEPGTEVPDTPGTPVGIYLRGEMNEWGVSPEYEFMATEEIGVYVIPYIKLEATEFKIGDENWGSVNLGGQGDDVVIDEEYALNGSDNIMLIQAFEGAIILTNNDGNYSVLFTPYNSTTQGEASGIFLRGGMNDWGTDAAYEFKTGPVENVWYLENVSITAGEEFKVADEGWNPFNYGTNLEEFNEEENIGVIGLVYNAGNIKLTANFNGTLLLVKVGEFYFMYFQTPKAR